MESDIDIEKSKDGYNIVKVYKSNKSKFIGSKYNQAREVQKFIDGLSPLYVEDRYIVIGGSLGEHIDELLKVNCGEILIIEPEESLIDNLKGKYKYNNNVKVVNNENEIRSYFNTHVDDINIDLYKCSVYSNYNDIYKEEIQDLFNVLKEEVNKKVLQRNTNLHFSEIWMKIFYENLKQVGNSVNNDLLKDKYKNVPAIIVSAGPSLEKNIKQLKGVDNTLIISGGRTLRSLCENEINTDYLVVTDPGEISYNLVKDYLPNVKSPLVYYHYTNNDVIKNHIGDKIIASNHPYIENIVGKECFQIAKGGSVAHSMITFAAHLGCNPIIFIGQDLAYTNNQLHGDISRNKGSKYTSKEFERNDDLIIKDIYGNHIKTSITLNTFRLELEAIIREFNEIDFINCTEGGAAIEGTVNRQLKDVLDELKSNEVLRFDISECESIGNKKVIENLNKTINQYHKIKKLLKIAMSILDDYINKNIQIRSDKRNLLDKTSSEIRKSLSDLSLLSASIYNIMYKINNENKILVTDNEITKERKSYIKEYEVYWNILNLINSNEKNIKNIIGEIEKGVK